MITAWGGAGPRLVASPRSGSAFEAWRPRPDHANPGNVRPALTCFGKVAAIIRQREQPTPFDRRLQTVITNNDLYDKLTL